MGVSRKLVHALHLYSADGMGGFIEEFVPSLAVEGNMTVVSIPIAEYGDRRLVSFRSHHLLRDDDLFILIITHTHRLKHSNVAFSRSWLLKTYSLYLIDISKFIIDEQINCMHWHCNL